MTETALVLLNKSDKQEEVVVTRYLSAGLWNEAFTGRIFELTSDSASLRLDVPAHGIRLLTFHEPVSNPDALVELDRLQAKARRRIP